MAATNSYVDTYNRMRKDLFKGKNSRDVNRSVPIEFYIEWDRLRMILNPKVNLSPAQLKLGKYIPTNWRDECD